MDITSNVSTYTNNQQKEEQSNIKTKDTILSLFPSLIPDMFSVEELDKFAYIGELGHLNRKHLDSLFKNIF